jgi:hypothetical protein
VFIKLPEAKTDSFPARQVDVRDMELALRKFPSVSGDPPRIQLSEPIPAPWLEARFFVFPDGVSRGSVYRLGASIWGSGALDRLLEGLDRISDMVSEMRDLVSGLVQDVACPPGFSVDVGRRENGTLVVVEANAAWSSNPYDSKVK